MPSTVHLVAGARPNFIKIAPLWHALRDVPELDAQIVHTGQHTDINMSNWFFRDLGLAQPDHHLHAVTGSHANVTGSVMQKYEELLRQSPPDLCVVVGDVDSTLACAVVSKKSGVPVAHLEAGLRSFDMSMPEEINRILVDRIADLLWTPSEDGDQNLRAEGVTSDRIVRVGNIMIDSLLRIQAQRDIADLDDRFGFTNGNDYALVTMHRPANVDNRETLEVILHQVAEMSSQLQVLFPVHPRTRKRMDEFGLSGLLNSSNIRMMQPCSYPDFSFLMENARLLISDSGGVQEEAAFLGIPCLTVRPNTERPITLTLGTNKLIAPHEILTEATRIVQGQPRTQKTIPLWDGHTAERVVDSIKAFLANRQSSQ